MPVTEFFIDDVLSSSDWWGGISSRAVRRWLAENASAKELTVRINSVGGEAFEGIAIYNALRKHGARIIIDVEGLAASAASVVAMAGDEIRVSKGAQIMIHEASGITWGTADEHDSKAHSLRTINGEVADIYAARTGQTRQKCLDLMADETWMAADEAKKLGFCDVILAAKAKASEPQSMARQQAFMSAVFKHPPKIQPAPRAQMNTAPRTPLGELARATMRIGSK